MRHFSTIALALLAVLFLTLAPASAGNKFKNKDTAKNRQDNVFGTKSRAGGTDMSVEKNERGATVIRNTPIKKEETDWYDKIHINVEPQVDWPTDSSTTSTSTEETVDQAGDTTTTTTTTESSTTSP